MPLRRDVTFGIVTISYNQSRFLEECLNSIASQTEVRIQHVIVDAGSDDGSLELLRSYSGLHEVLVGPDDGPADGLNMAFARLGEIDFFGYVNSDDYLLPRALATIAAAARMSPEFDIYYGDGLLVDEDGTTVRHYRAPPRLRLRGVAIGVTIPLQQSMFFRRGCLPASPFNRANRTAWDTELLLDRLRAGFRTVRVPAELAAFRIHADGFTGSGRHLHRVKQEHRRMYVEYCGVEWNALTTVEALGRRVGKAMAAAIVDPGYAIVRARQLARKPSRARAGQH